VARAGDIVIAIDDVPLAGFDHRSVEVPHDEPADVLGEREWMRFAERAIAVAAEECELDRESRHLQERRDDHVEPTIGIEVSGREPSRQSARTHDRAPLPAASWMPGNPSTTPT
jgi:hypothetical protein